MKSVTNKQHNRQKRILKRENRWSPSQKYTLEKSPLYRLGGPNELAELMGLPFETIRATSKQPEYHCFDMPPTGRGKNARHVQEPVGATQVLHYRFAKFLNRVVRPAFLHSATKGRSHITNADAHTGKHPIVCADIEKFYENTTRAHVKNFLRQDLQWPIDLAALMADVLTFNQHLPTGSAASPILSYFTHKRLFAEIEEICERSDSILTLFIDDITISGPHATKALLRNIKRILLKRGLVAATIKDKFASTGSSVVITGAVRAGETLRIRNKHRHKIVLMLEKYAMGDLSMEPVLRSHIAAVGCVNREEAGAFTAKLNHIMRNHVDRALTFIDEPLTDSIRQVVAG